MTQYTSGTLKVCHSGVAAARLFDAGVPAIAAAPALSLFNATRELGALDRASDGGRVKTFIANLAAIAP